MTNSGLFKSSLSYAVSTVKSNFFKLMGYLLGVLLLSAVFTLSFAILTFFLLGNGWQVGGILLALSSAVLLVASVACFYAVTSAVSILPRNMLNMYDKKPLSGFTPFFAPYSAALVFVY